MLYFFILEFNYLSMHKNRGEKSISYQLWISAAALDHTASRLYTTPKIRYWQKPITASPQLTQNLHIRASNLQWTSSILLSLIRNIYFKEHKTEFCVTFSYPQIFILWGIKPNISHLFWRWEQMKAVGPVCLSLLQWLSFWVWILLRGFTQLCLKTICIYGLRTFVKQTWNSIKRIETFRSSVFHKFKKNYFYFQYLLEFFSS